MGEPAKARGMRPPLPQNTEFRHDDGVGFECTRLGTNSLLVVMTTYRVGEKPGQGHKRGALQSRAKSYLYMFVFSQRAIARA